MEIARHVLDTYFADTTNPLVRHHLDSYADLLNSKIPKFLEGTNPLNLVLGDDRSIQIFVGGKNSNELRYLPPVDELGNAVLPHMCRLNNTTYALKIVATILVEYQIGKETETKKFENIVVGSVPLMLKSSLCYLSSMTSDELYAAGECKFELGGYFIIGGAEKTLLTQERLADNMFYASKRRVVSSSEASSRTLVEKEAVSKLEDATKAEPFEYLASIRSISEDGTKGPYSHFLLIPPKNSKPDDPKVVEAEPDYGSFSNKRLATITLPGFTQPVPLLSAFYALGLTTDQDIYDTILAGIPQQDKEQYDEIFIELLLSHDRYVAEQMKNEEDKDQDPNLLFLRRQARTRSAGGVYVNLFEQMFPHCEPRTSESAASFYRRKAYLLGHMTRMAMDVANGKPKTDRDSLKFKRLYASGELIFREFRDVFTDTAKRMLTELDTRVHFEQQAYAGKKLAELVQDENIGYYWRQFNFMNSLEKSFKGKWGGKDGVSQELSRLGYLGTVAQLRRVNVDMDKGTKIIESRRIHGSSWGMLCPSDNPDGGNIGLIKSMTLLSTISSASPSQKIYDLILAFPKFSQITIVHPSTWNPEWTKVFLNSDLVGVCESDTEDLHKILLRKRRDGEFSKFVSLSWNRIQNEYSIFTDAGRPMRPIYREGTSASQVKKVSKWSALVSKHMDYVDIDESESLRISMEPFSEQNPSEIHGLAIFSASAGVLPFSDFNPGTRNAFSCQQAKAGCSWFNTAFNKRFDTISTWLNYAQRPLSQTWLYKSVLGNNGCLPYGENPIVALMVYSGYNQEDSVLLNEGSLKRGMFHTTVYHAYDVAEKMIDVMARTHNEFGNPATDPRFREVVTRKEGYNYDFLDGDGIIKVGSQVDDKTILVGILSPSFNGSGQVKGYSDSSSGPKRGQTGIVDAVYRYSTSEGLRGVKIRVAEHRIPVIGDKFSARHGQKGTVGLRVPEEDMPFTASGIKPDMIVNPHAFPSRMTIGMFLEMMANKLGLEMGALVDATPFSSKNRVPETRDLLTKAGFHPYGHETMYNGQTGEMMEAEFFMAPCYYLRIKQMVEDKINYRATGPKKLLTHQPVEGRSNDGGLRIGEMERDVLVSYGISKFLNESLMERSDKTEVLFQPETGLIDANAQSQPSKLDIPYALKLVVHELEAMHISIKLAAP
jgi:DNA-directed RNA polymerase II subunit RPB2